MSHELSAMDWSERFGNHRESGDTAFNFKSPFRTLLLSAPWHIQAALLEYDIYAVQPDGELLSMMLTSDCDLAAKIAHKAVLLLADRPFPNAEKDAIAQVLSLGKVASQGIQTEDYTDFMLTLLPGCRAAYRLSVYPTTQPLLLKKWRHVTKAQVLSVEPRTQRALELELRQKWALRIVALFTPWASQLKVMKQLMDCQDPTQEWVDLLGAARFGTLRARCLDLEKLLKISPQLMPLTEDSLRVFLNCLRSKDTPPSTIQRFWKTLKYFMSRYHDLTCFTEALKEKKDAIRNEMVKELLKESKKAVVPSLNVVEALEKGTTTGTFCQRHLCGVARFLLGSSGRFSDGQHVVLANVAEHSDTIEVRAWQTKTMSLLDNNNKPKVLIAPKKSFSGVPWWQGFLHTVTVISTAEQFEGADYLLPALTRCRGRFIPRPCKHSQGISALRDTLRTLMVSQEETSSITWHSFRVFMADWACRADISRDRRRYIGQWSAESTADQYVRSHRSIITAIWEEVTNHDVFKQSSRQADRQAHENITGDQYFPLDPQEKKRKLSHQGPLATSSENAHEAGVPLLEEVPVGNLFVVVAKRKTGSPPLFSVHLFTRDLVGVGCSWAPPRERYENLAKHDYIDQDSGVAQDKYRLCSKCFKLHSLPSDWPQDLPYHQQKDEETASDSSGGSSCSSSASSNDTASESEAFTPPSLS